MTRAFLILRSWALDAGLRTLDSGLWMLDSRRWTLDTGLWTLALELNSEP